MSYGNQPFGIKNTQVAATGSSVWIDVPLVRKLTATPRIINAENRGDDSVGSVHSHLEAYDLSMEYGVLSPEVAAITLGIDAAETGTTPNRVTTTEEEAGTVFPYFQLRGVSVAEDGGSTWQVFPKCKIKSIGEIAQSQDTFAVSNVTATAVTDGTRIRQLIQYETYTDLS
jgi:hypothetical protein